MGKHLDIFVTSALLGSNKNWTDIVSYWRFKEALKIFAILSLTHLQQSQEVTTISLDLKWWRDGGGRKHL